MLTKTCLDREAFNSWGNPTYHENWPESLDLTTECKLHHETLQKRRQGFFYYKEPYGRSKNGSNGWILETKLVKEIT